MVDITPEEVMALKNGKELDVLSERDRAVLGSSSARLLIPLDHPERMTEYADVLVELGPRLKAICARTDWPPRLVMSEYRNEIRSAQWRIDHA